MAANMHGIEHANPQGGPSLLTPPETQRLPQHQPNQASDEQRVIARQMLMSTFNITSAFVRVHTLADILGLSKVTIYASMRQGRFFIPHRMLNTAPVVKLDDVVEWYCLPGGADPFAKTITDADGVPGSFQNSGSGLEHTRSQEAAATDMDISKARMKTHQKRQGEQLVAEVLATMGIAQKSKPKW